MASSLFKILSFSLRAYETKLFLALTKFIFFITCLCLLHLCFKEQKPSELSSFIFLEIIFLFALVSSKNTSFIQDKHSGFIDEMRLSNSLDKYIISEFILNTSWNLLLMVAAVASFYLLFDNLNISHAIPALILVIPALQGLIMIAESFALEIENNLIPIIFTMIFFFPIAILASLSLENNLFIIALFGMNLIFIPLSMFLIKKIIDLLN